MERVDLKTQFDSLTQTFLSLSKQLEERLKLVEEKEKNFQELEEKMKMNASLAKTKIKLDVGGKVFATSKNTLLAFEGSYFHTMLSSGHWKPDEDGTYFIDRNPKHFGIILDYMRTHKIDLSDYSSKQLDQLQEDLDYYQIKIPTDVSVFIPSSILDSTMKATLTKMLPLTAKKFRLVLDSKQGTGVSVFDNAVKGLSPTLIIIKANTGYVFGAFVMDTWGCSGGWIKGNMETFLYSLGDGKTPPVKLLHSGNGNGIHITSCGLHLGDSGDLTAFCTHSCCAPQTYNKVAPGYQARSIDANLLAGCSSWNPQLMEVFVCE